MGWPLGWVFAVRLHGQKNSSEELSSQLLLSTEEESSVSAVNDNGEMVCIDREGMADYRMCSVVVKNEGHSAM